MKKDILEQIIKTVLFEQENIDTSASKEVEIDTVAPLREKRIILAPLSKSQRAEIVESGGITGFNVTMKFDKFASMNTTVFYSTIINYIKANRQIGTIGSFNVLDTTNDQPRYTYILNNLDIARSKRSLNCVITVLLYSPLYQLASDIDDTNQNTRLVTQLTDLTYLTVGNIPVYLISDMSKFIALLKMQATKAKLELVDNKLNKKIAFPNLVTIDNITPPVETSQSEKAVAVNSDKPFTPQNLDVTQTDASADKEVNITTDTDTSTKIIYPYTLQSGNIVYTMSDSDQWVYTLVNSDWYTMKKLDFESMVNGGPQAKQYILPKSNTAVYNKLNALLK